MTDLSWLGMQPPPDSAPRPATQSTFRWATVVGTVPLQIRLDGETVPLPDPPETLVGGLSPGRRVWVQLHGRMAVIVGAASSDTDWVPIVVNTSVCQPYTQAPQARRRNDVIELTGGFTSLTGTGIRTLGTIPTEVGSWYVSGWYYATAADGPGNTLAINSSTRQITTRFGSQADPAYVMLHGIRLAT